MSKENKELIGFEESAVAAEESETINRYRNELMQILEKHKGMTRTQISGINPTLNGKLMQFDREWMEVVKLRASSC
jgi:hypothetical protein